MPGNQKNIQLGVFDHICCGGNQIHFGVFAEAVVIAGAGDAIAVRHFDHVHAALIQLRGDFADLIRREAVGYGMGAVPQGGIDNVNLLCHNYLPSFSSRSAIFPRRQWQPR